LVARPDRPKLCKIVQTNFVEFYFFPRTWVNKGKRKGRGC
jgi:hypothetical protein